MESSSFLLKLISRYNYFILFTLIIFSLSLSSFLSFGQAPDIEIWVECIQPNNDGTFLAHFGYNNPGSNYKVDETKSVLIYNGSEQKWDALNEFQPGIHHFVVQRALQGNDRVRWRLTLPNGYVQNVEASASTNICLKSKLSISITGPVSSYNGETVEFGYSVSPL